MVGAHRLGERSEGGEHQRPRVLVAHAEHVLQRDRAALADGARRSRGARRASLRRRVRRACGGAHVAKHVRGGLGCRERQRLVVELGEHGQHCVQRAGQQARGGRAVQGADAAHGGGRQAAERRRAVGVLARIDGRREHRAQQPLGGCHAHVGAQVGEEHRGRVHHQLVQHGLAVARGSEERGERIRHGGRRARIQQGHQRAQGAHELQRLARAALRLADAAVGRGRGHRRRGIVGARRPGKNLADEARDGLRGVLVRGRALRRAQPSLHSHQRPLAHLGPRVHAASQHRAERRAGRRPAAVGADGRGEEVLAAAEHGLLHRLCAVVSNLNAREHAERHLTLGAQHRARRRRQHRREQRRGGGGGLGTGLVAGLQGRRG
mmetsp:Transcript_11335/g.47324  ORF Transcript_11335/g.47324 Transcript_11335/m.47324 type:complete len:379 (+) Transcript_11335:2110-3246(+)